MIGSLFVTPWFPADTCDTREIITTLRALNIIAEPLAQTMDALVFQAGPDYPRHVVYAGCSPHLRFEPATPGDKMFCHVAVHGPYAETRILAGENSVKPRCPHCRKRLADWQQRLQLPPLECPACGKQLPVSQLDWRQHAAVGRIFVEMRNVFPGEASPSDQLLSALEKSTGFRWRYAWSALLDEKASS